MKEISSSCCGCETHAKINNETCPMCQNKGISVGRITVEHLVKGDFLNAIDGNHYRICMNEACEVVYYNEDQEKILKDQVNVPIWFKKDANPKYACYCSKVTEDEVMDAVVNQGAMTVQEVNTITGAMKNSNCKENNPLGVCCHKIIQAAINKGLEMK